MVGDAALRKIIGADALRAIAGPHFLAAICRPRRIDTLTLGPIGFYLTSRVGEHVLFALGMVWPAALGSLLWWVAARRFQRSDLV